LLEGGPRILQAYPEDLSRKGAQQLKDLGVDVRTGTMVQDLGAGYVKVKGGERIDAAVMVWAAGVGASEAGAMLNVEMDRRKRVRVNKFLNPAGHPEIFVCGDLAVVEQDGHEIPGVAQPAIQMGEHAALMIQQDLRGEDRQEFRYFDKGDMATIGRYRAIAAVKWPFRGHWSGLPAWMMWLVVHLAFLIGFRNRVIVLMQWGWTYLFFLRSSRLIVGSKELPGWPPHDSKLDNTRPDHSAQPENVLY
jgi:NADH dehydrogenase